MRRAAGAPGVCRHAGSWIVALLPLVGAQALAQPPVELYPSGPLQVAPGVAPVFGSQHPRPVDIDGDGRQDLLRVSTWEINVALGLGNHQFQPWITTAAQPQACWDTNANYAVGDFDGDGSLDVVMQHRSSTGCSFIDVYYYYGLGNGAFASPRLVTNIAVPETLGSAGSGLHAAQVIPGGADELIIWAVYFGPRTADVQVWSASDSGFVLLSSLPLDFNGAQLPSLGVGDFNGDGVDDMLGTVLGSSGGQAVILLEGSATAPHLRLSATLVPTSLGDNIFALWDWIRDVNEDGYDDLIMHVQAYGGSPTPIGHYLAVGLGAPAGALTTWLLSPLSEPCFLAGYRVNYFDDYDADGHLDALIGVLEGSATCWPPASLVNWVFYRGDGTGRFQRGISTGALGFGPMYPMQAVDSDQDGDLDYWGSFDGVGTFWSQNDTLTGTGQAPAGTPIPRTTVGLPRPGNPDFFIGVEGAAPQALCVMALSSGIAPAPGPLPGLLIDLSPSALLLPSGSLGWLKTSDTGAASLPMPLQSDASLAGSVVYLQALALSGVPAGIAISAMRRIVIW